MLQRENLPLSLVAIVPLLMVPALSMSVLCQRWNSRPSRSILKRSMHTGRLGVKWNLLFMCYGFLPLLKPTLWPAVRAGVVQMGLRPLDVSTGFLNQSSFASQKVEKLQNLHPKAISRAMRHTWSNVIYGSLSQSLSYSFLPVSTFRSARLIRAVYSTSLESWFWVTNWESPLTLIISRP